MLWIAALAACQSTLQESDAPAPAPDAAPDAARAEASDPKVGDAAPTANENATELPEATIRFEGQSNVSEASLRSAARRELEAYQRGRRPADAADAAYSMEVLLRETGHARGVVEFRVESDALVFVVKEGPETLYDGVVFAGIDDPEELRQLREIFTFPGTGPLATGTPLYRLADVEEALAQVEKFYLLGGHLRVAIEDPAVEFVEEGTKARITVTVKRGPKYTVRNVTFDGIEPRDLGVTGAPFHVRLPAEAAAAVRRELLDGGHQRQEVSGTAKVDEKEKVADIHIAAKPGPRVKLGSVHFRGHKRTRESFLRRRIPLRDADVLAQRILDRGIGNLYRTALFGAIRPTLIERGPDVSDLEIRLDELPARSLDLELGYGSYELARAAVRYRDRNIFGTGRRFGTEARASVRSFGIDFNFEDPYILGRNRSFEITTGFLLREEPSFDREAFQVELVVTQTFESSPWNKYRVRGGYRLRVEKARNAPPDLEIDAQTEGFTRTAGLFLSITRDTRDNLLIPRSGTFSDISFLWSAAPLGADLEFLEIDLRGSVFRALGERVVFGAHVRLRTRHVLNDDATLPIQERLFLGGEASVRSFFESELGPSSSGEALGGLTSAYATFELRYRLWRALHVAPFYDVGMVSPQSFDAVGPPGHAIGLGLRYYLPVGPLRVDFAYNPGRRFAASQSWAIHLAFGFTF